VVFGLSRCDEQLIPEIKAELIDISSLDDAKDSSAESPDSKAYLNTVLPQAMTARPYPLNLSSPLPIPPLIVSTDAVKFALAIPPAKSNPLAGNYFKIPHRPANQVVLELEHVPIKPPTQDRLSGYEYTREGEGTN